MPIDANYTRMVLDVRQMSHKSRRDMLHDVIDNMLERDDADEIVRFLAAQLGGDAADVISAYAYPNGLSEPIRQERDEIDNQLGDLK